MRETGPAASRQATGSRAVVSVFAGAVLLAIWGCSPAAEEAVTVETIIDGSDPPVQTFEIEEGPTASSVADEPLAVDGSLPTTDPATEPDPDPDRQDDAAASDEEIDEPVGESEEASDDSTTTTPSTNPPVVTTPSTIATSSGSNGRPDGPGVTVSANDLVGAADQTVVEPETCDLDIPCATLPATNGDSKGAVAMGEYQRGVFVPLGAEVDIYFDQSRSVAEMDRICDELGGVLATRSQDGSRWAGWRYCHGIDY